MKYGLWFPAASTSGIIHLSLLGALDRCEWKDSSTLEALCNLVTKKKERPLNFH